MRHLRPLVLTLLAAGLAGPAGAAGGVRLEARGGGLPARLVERLVAPALRAPGDSLALARALDAVLARLQADGHLDARVTGAWSGPAAARWLQLEMDPGPPLRLVDLRLDAPSPAESAAFQGLLGLRIGAPASPPAFGAAARQAVDRLAERGHPYAELAIHALDWDSAGARLRLGGVVGPRVTVVGARVEGLQVTRASFVDRALGRNWGRVFDPAAAVAGRDRLAGLGLFSTVQYEGLEGENDRTRARFVYRVVEPAYNRFEGAAGTRSSGRPTGLLRLDLGNLAGTGRALAARWESRGAGDEIVAARYVEPFVAGLPLRLEARLESQREDTTFTRALWALRLQAPLGPRDRFEAGYEQDHVLEAGGPVREADLQNTVFAIDHDGRDDAGAPRSGWRTRLAATQSFKREGLRGGGRRKAAASAVEGQAEWHHPLGARWGVAMELSGAGRFSAQPILALYERWPLGGAATLRGHDEQAFRVDRFGLSRTELRWHAGAGGTHAALFWDHARTWSRLPAGAETRIEERRRDGIGFGLRFDGRGGRIRVDYGLEPGRSPAEGKLHLQLVSSF